MHGFNHRQPMAFISFAGPDRPMAERLGRDLAAHGFGSFVDARSIVPGEDIILAINKALTDSNYCVLLWSRHTVGRPWVNLEWTTALTRELNTRRSFLFILRLDDSPMFDVLVPRRYLDASTDWDAAVAALVAAWRRDREFGPHVFPAPDQATTADCGGDDVVELYIRNQDLSVAHVMRDVPRDCTGRQLSALVAKALNLQDEQAAPGGIVVARFTYELRLGDRTLPEGPLTGLEIRDGAVVDLVVHCEFESRSGTRAGAWTFRDGQSSRPSAPSPQIIRLIIDAAFGHLMP